MNFLSAIAFVATLTAVSATPTGSIPSRCAPEQANKCCTGLTNGFWNLNVLPEFCPPLVGSCNNQAACCETNGILGQQARRPQSFGFVATKSKYLQFGNARHTCSNRRRYMAADEICLVLDHILVHYDITARIMREARPTGFSKRSSLPRCEGTGRPEDAIRGRKTVQNAISRNDGDWPVATAVFSNIFGLWIMESQYSQWYIALGLNKGANHLANRPRRKEHS
ncbi:hypothetical protein BBP40_010026 [Aspergillus hancockii]|nr:hypothetical protein BBP40_010026 [Aspergillus hancockii]